MPADKWFYSCHHFTSMYHDVSTCIIMYLPLQVDLFQAPWPFRVAPRHGTGVRWCVPQRGAPQCSQTPLALSPRRVGIPMNQLVTWLGNP